MTLIFVFLVANNENKYQVIDKIKKSHSLQLGVRLCLHGNRCPSGLRKSKPIKQNEIAGHSTLKEQRQGVRRIQFQNFTT